VKLGDDNGPTIATFSNRLAADVRLPRSWAEHGFSDLLDLRAAWCIGRPFFTVLDLDPDQGPAASRRPIACRARGSRPAPRHGISPEWCPVTQPPRLNSRSGGGVEPRETNPGSARCSPAALGPFLPGAVMAKPRTWRPVAIQRLGRPFFRSYPSSRRRCDGCRTERRGSERGTERARPRRQSDYQPDQQADQAPAQGA